MARSRKMVSVNGTLTLSGQVAVSTPTAGSGRAWYPDTGGASQQVGLWAEGRCRQGPADDGRPGGQSDLFRGWREDAAGRTGLPVLAGRTAVLRYSRVMPAALATLTGKTVVVTNDIVLKATAWFRVDAVWTARVSRCHTDPAQANGTEIRSEGVSKEVVMLRVFPASPAFVSFRICLPATITGRITAFTTCHRREGYGRLFAISARKFPNRCQRLQTFMPRPP